MGKYKCTISRTQMGTTLLGYIAISQVTESYFILVSGKLSK